MWHNNIKCIWTEVIKQIKQLLFNGSMEAMLSDNFLCVHHYNIHMLDGTYPRTRRTKARFPLALIRHASGFFVSLSSRTSCLSAFLCSLTYLSARLKKVFLANLLP